MPAANENPSMRPRDASRSIGGSDLEVGGLGLRRADVAELIECLGEQLVEQLQPIQILDDAADVEVQLVHTFRKLRTEPPLIVLHREVDLFLRSDEIAELLLRQQG